MTLKYLITGATGGLGKQVLNYFTANVPLSEFAVASSSAANKSIFENCGIAFRHVNYDDPQSLEAGLRDVENLLFVSTGDKHRGEQHANVIEAAKNAEVKHIWYTSLAFGGFQDTSKAPVMQDHLLTERLLKESGLTYTSIREGVYAECFTIFLDWYAERSGTITLPADGEVAYTSRAELGEATARIMINGGYENQVVLFTAGETITAREIVDIINETTDRQIKLDLVSREECLRAWMRDPRDKPREHFEMIATVWDEIVRGALRTTHPLLREILGREPTKPRDFVRRLLEEDRNYVFPY
ncbi:hypothetical protein BDV38DRAFT_291103 [Aspergillus pseudotamarii]|uniref:NmrA-like domain-containing protein n=1 Tax=Aspergillus pseudotamarii TaxID=132259 RepID=A0A5N6SYW3_ASPPS|nr:uncharacterized protein BDV38DRAFT_291103 [Aspergillus pseudotamarii]KAE8139822.1 hypothetical protein BDV38DRAFT_291103 [Aspergillus pseudotamarii]